MNLKGILGTHLTYSLILYKQGTHTKVKEELNTTTGYVITCSLRGKGLNCS